MLQAFFNTVAVFGLPAFLATASIARSLQLPFSQLRKRKILGKLLTWLLMLLLWSSYMASQTEYVPGYLPDYGKVVAMLAGVALGYRFAKHLGPIRRNAKR